MRFAAMLAMCGGLLCTGGLAFAQTAADFPPGPFTDGGQYQLSDFKGKVLVLYFFEPT